MFLPAALAALLALGGCATRPINPPIACATRRERLSKHRPKFSGCCKRLARKSFPLRPVPSR